MGLPPKADGPASSELISRIGDLYHRTLWRDTRIAKELPEELGLKVTRNQVQESGLKKAGYAVHPIPISALSDNLKLNKRPITSYTPVPAVHTVAVGRRMIYVVVSKLAGQGFVS